MQITSEKTFIKDIKILEAGCDLNWDGISVIILSKKTEALLSKYSYEKLVTLGCELVALELRSIVEKFGFFILSLSGGRDSRALLAACRYTFKDKFSDYIHVRTGTADHQKPDSDVATKLAEYFNFKLTSQLPVPSNRKWYKLIHNQALNRWTVSNLGLYYNMNYSNDYYYGGGLVSIRGGQGNAAGDLGKIENISKKINLETGLPLSFIISHFESSIKRNLISEGEDVIDRNYMCWRYRIHYGRNSSNISQWALNIDPLINPFFDAANMRLSQEERYAGVLSRDIICAFDPECLRIGFSTKNAAFNSDFITSSTRQFRRRFFSFYLPHHRSLS